jgi:molybdenum cofactor biosynthesis enzyme MoaA
MQSELPVLYKDYFPVKFIEKDNPPLPFASILDILESVYKKDRRKRKIHFSGRAEPLVIDNENLEKELSAINSAYPKFEKVMTTNAFLLPGKSQILFENGIKRLNVSVHNDSFKNKKYIAGIESAVDAGMKICLNILIDEKDGKRISGIIGFAVKYNLDMKFFTILGISKTETEDLIRFCDFSLLRYSSKREFDEIKNRFVHKLNRRVNAYIKIPVDFYSRPDACFRCNSRDFCLEGCWDSIRITPWYIKPCGIRNDNVYFFSENNIETLKQKLKSGGKL